MAYKSIFHLRPKQKPRLNSITCRTEEYDSFFKLTCHVPESITRFGAPHNDIYLQLAQNGSFEHQELVFTCNSSDDLEPYCRGNLGYGLGGFNGTDWTFNIDNSKIKRQVGNVPFKYRCQLSPPVEDDVSIPCTFDFASETFHSNLTRDVPNSSATCIMNTISGNNSVTCHFPNSWPDQFQLQYKENLDSSEAAKPVTYCDTVDTLVKCRSEIPDIQLQDLYPRRSATFSVPENMTDAFFSCKSGGRDSGLAPNWCNRDLQASLYNATSSYGSEMATTLATGMTTGMATEMTTGMATEAAKGWLATAGVGLIGLGALGAGFIGAKKLWNRKRKRDDDSLSVMNPLSAMSRPIVDAGTYETGRTNA